MSVRQFTPPPYVPAFTHRPGTMIYLAGSSHAVQVYPAALRIFACRTYGLELVKEVSFPEFGPLSDWVVFIDSLHQFIQIQGRSKGGFVRYRVYTTEEGIFLKPSTGTIKIANNGILSEIGKSEECSLVKTSCSLPRFPTPRLLLGCQKAPNWDRIAEMPSMQEVLPLWYQVSPPSGDLSLSSSATLFGSIVEAFQKKCTTDFLSAIHTFFRVGIEGFFVPKRHDTLFLGYKDPILPDELLLSQLHPSISFIIRSLFIAEEGNSITLLPRLPKELVCGRLVHETLLSGHQIDIEWRKGKVRRVLLHAAHDGVITIKTGAKTASIRSLHPASRKKPFFVGQEIEVIGGKQYLLDHFSS
jgi:hypothetical protein